MYIRNILRVILRTWVVLRDLIMLPIWRLWARFLGATVHPSVRFSGRPKIQVIRGSRIIFKEGVVVHSSISANPVIGRRTTTLATIAPGAILELESNVGISGVCICAASEIRIGEGTIIGADAMILDNDFHLPLPNWRWENRAAETAKPIHIGRGCFIGARAIILKGVTLGDGAVVGAGAVVTRDVPAGHLAFGNPAVNKPLPEKWKRKR
jgi:acetyltransferase-like isoleucine patch superfamily enzyme